MYSPFDYNFAFHLDFPLRTECADWVILGPRLLVSFVLFFTITYIPSVFYTFPLETLVFFSLLICSEFIPFTFILKKMGNKHLGMCIRVRGRRVLL